MPPAVQQWDINNAPAEAPEPAHIIVANNLSATAKDLPSAVAALYEQTLEGGFLCLQVDLAALSCSRLCMLCYRAPLQRTQTSKQRCLSLPRPLISSHRSFFVLLLLCTQSEHCKRL